MARTSQRRIAVAQDFVRIGFGEAIDDNAPFYSHDFLTQDLTTVEARAVISVLKRYNRFDGEKVATAIEKFRGRVSGWKFGSTGSPLLLVILAPWTHQVEDTPPGGKSGVPFTAAERAALTGELKKTFLQDLGADKFEADSGSEFAWGAWWD